MYETQICAVGTVITAVQRRTLADGTALASFRMACNERRYNRTEDKWYDGNSVYMSVSCWRALAGHVTESLSVGDPVMVSGKLHTRQYDRDGRQGVVIEVEATAVGPDLARSTAVVTRAGRSSRVEPSVDPPVQQGVGGAPPPRAAEVAVGVG